MAQKTETVKVATKKKKGWFQKIPTRVLFSPAGIFLAGFAVVMEGIDLIPAFFIVEIILEIIFIILLKTLVKDISWKALIIPFGIERFDFLGILPTWAITMIV